jgi:hypothetical protein
MLINEEVVGSMIVSIVSYVQLVIRFPRIYFGEILSYLGILVPPVDVGCCAGWKLGLTYTNKLPE